VGLSILVGTALAYGNDWRYSVQVAPIAWLLGSAGLVLIVGAVADRLRRQEPAVPGALSSRRVEDRR
jgi:hypothetical protein